jgi:hypothetical protein
MCTCIVGCGITLLLVSPLGCCLVLYSVQHTDHRVRVMARDICRYARHRGFVAALLWVKPDGSYTDELCEGNNCNSFSALQREAFYDEIRCDTLRSRGIRRIEKRWTHSGIFRQFASDGHKVCVRTECVFVVHLVSVRQTVAKTCWRPQIATGDVFHFA